MNASFSVFLYVSTGVDTKPSTTHICHSAQHLVSGRPLTLEYTCFFPPAFASRV
jgi:hypothetical protein